MIEKEKHTPHHVQALRQHLETTNTTLTTKGDWTTWWHAAAAWAMHAVFFILRVITLGNVDKRFGDYWTTLGDTVYAPRGYTVDLTNPHDYAVVCHELAHRYDDITHGWRYRVSYLLSGTARARWELRGYGMQMLAYHRAAGRLPYNLPTMFARAISGPAYLWAGDKTQLERAFRSIERAVLDDTISAELHDPNDDAVFQALTEL